jgi:hypothetical protein
MNEEINPGPGWRLATEADVGRTDVSFMVKEGLWSVTDRLAKVCCGKFFCGFNQYDAARVRDTATATAPALTLKPGTWYRTAVGSKWFYVGPDSDGNFAFEVDGAFRGCSKDIDLTGWSEWREPRTWEVEVWLYVKPDGSRTFSSVELKGEFLAKKRIVETLVEGDGL